MFSFFTTYTLKVDNNKGNMYAATYFFLQNKQNPIK